VKNCAKTARQSKKQQPKKQINREFSLLFQIKVFIYQVHLNCVNKLQDIVELDYFLFIKTKLIIQTSNQFIE